MSDSMTEMFIAIMSPGATKSQTQENVLKQLGIPTDRMELVKRNLELKSKLISAMNLADALIGTHHRLYHDDVIQDWKKCGDPVCLTVLEALLKLRP